MRDPAYKSKGSQDLVAAMTPEMILDYMGILIDSNAAQNVNMKLNLIIVSQGAAAETYLVTLNSGVLLYQPGVQSPDADATITCPKAGLFAILTNNPQGIAQIKVEGDATALIQLTAHLTPLDFFFNIVEP